MRESWRRITVHQWYPSSRPQQRVVPQLRQLQRWHPNFVVVCSLHCVEEVSEILDVLRGTRRYCQTATVLAVRKGVAVEDSDDGVSQSFNSEDNSEDNRRWEEYASSMEWTV